MPKLKRILAPLSLVLAVIIPTGAVMVLADGLSAGTTGVLTAAKPPMHPQPVSPPGYEHGQQPSSVEVPRTGKSNRDHSL